MTQQHPAALCARPPRAPGISWIGLLVGDTSGVRRARTFVADVISPYINDADHMHTVQWAASEALGNAIVAADKYAKRLGWTWSYLDVPVRLGVCCTARWVRLDVRDPDPVMPPRTHNEIGDEHGRGRDILDLLAVRVWHTSTAWDKTVHILIAVPGVELTVDELERAAL